MQRAEGRRCGHMRCRTEVNLNLAQRYDSTLTVFGRPVDKSKDKHQNGEKNTRRLHDFVCFL